MVLSCQRLNLASRWYARAIASVKSGKTWDLSFRGSMEGEQRQTVGNGPRSAPAPGETLRPRAQKQNMKKATGQNREDRKQGRQKGLDLLNV